MATAGCKVTTGSYVIEDKSKPGVVHRIDVRDKRMMLNSSVSFSFAPGEFGPTITVEAASNPNADIVKAAVQGAVQGFGRTVVP